MPDCVLTSMACNVHLRTNKVQARNLMPFQIIVHADDIGISRTGTEKILEACDAKIISSVSIMPNGPAFGYAVQELKKRPDLRLSIHLNFLEGNPVSAAGEVDRIVDKNGRFYHSFQGLWVKYGLSGSLDKSILKQQIKKEMRAQIQKVIDHFGGSMEVNIDSHNHYHIIPFVFEVLLELSEEFDITYVRIPEEKFFWCFADWRASGRYVSSNIIKHFLLNAMSRGYKKKLDQLHIDCPEYFIGVLFSGYMTGRSVEAALWFLQGNTKKDGIIEILFHPGRAESREIEGWVQKKSFNDYYCSLSRDNEFNELMELTFKQLIGNFANIL